MGFNTAVFYDIENLLRGYAFSQQMLANLSLGEILEAVRRTGKIEQIAVQRAYANWSDPRLAIDFIKIRFDFWTAFCVSAKFGSYAARNMFP